MVVSEGAINNIMGGMENTAGVRLHSHRHKLKQRFDIIRKLGQGTYGKVQLAVNKETGQEVAIKTIKKAKIETEQDLIRIRREIQIMSSVQHPQIIHIYEVFENREKMVLVMEYAAGGELYDYLSERKVLPEEEARRVFRHVASATYYCHKHKICHRDLKLENILLDLEGNAKIADFGLSNVFDDKHRLDTFCGSPLYASPEIVKGIPYTGPEVDCWSLGVLLYTLVYGAMPFDGSNFKRLVKQITQGDYYEPKKPSRASDLIRSMLTVSATKRATVEEICAHWWVNEGYVESCLDIAEALANQTPVRLDLLLSLAPKHINSEHMLIQPEDEDSSMRSPPTSECSRPPPNLQLPPPPPPTDSTPSQPPQARSNSLSGIYSVNTADLDALFALKKKERREAEKKRKIEDTTSLEKKKKKDAVEGTPKPVRKDHKTEACASQETGSSSPRPPSVPAEANSSERKKIVKKVEESEASDRSEKSDRRKSIKRHDSTVENETNDTNEKSDRRRNIIKRRDSTVEREISDNDKKKIVVKKRENSASRPSKEDTADRRRSIRAKETPSREIRPCDLPPRELKPVASIAVESVSEPSSVISLDKSDTEDQAAAAMIKPPLPKEQGNKLKPPSNEVKSSRSSSNKSLNGPETEGAASMEVVEIVESLVPDTRPEGAQNSASMRSVGSSNEMTLKASDSSLSRESASPMKADVTTKGKESPKPSSSSPQTNEVKKTRSKSLLKNNSKSTINETTSVNGELAKPATTSEVGKENIPQDTTNIIKDDKDSKIPTPLKTQDSSSKVEESTKESSKSVSDAKKAFEKPTIEKPVLGPRKKSVTDTTSTTGPKPQTNLSIPQTKDKKEKSPSKEKVLKKELEKEKSPKKELEKEKSPKKEKEASRSPRRSCTPLRECEKAKIKEVENNKLKKEKVLKKEEGKSEEIIPNNKETKDVGGGVSSSVSNAEEKVQVARVGVDDRLVKPKTPTRTVEDTSTKPQRKSKIDIVLNKTEDPKSSNKRASYAEIKLSSPPPKETPRTQEFKTEIRHSVSSPRSNEGHRMTGETQFRSGDAHLQRAKRERIIPIMLEDTDDDDNTTSEPLARAGSSERSVGGMMSSVSSRVTSPQPLSHTALSRASQPTSPRASSPEPIRKSRRERIIPIQVEGCGVVTPLPASHVEEAAELGAARAHQAFQRSMGARAHSLSRGGNFLLDHSESFSSAGEEDEDEEDDAFQILTAESLFSTLLNRVRSLTRKMNDDPRIANSRRSSQQPTPEPMMGHVASGPSGSSGFWSSLYSSPRDSPSRRISENMSRSSIGRDDETLGGIGSPMWTRSVSRDTSDADTFFSEASTPFGTLPRVRGLRHSMHLPHPRLHHPGSFFLYDNLS